MSTFAHCPLIRLVFSHTRLVESSLLVVGDDRHIWAEGIFNTNIGAGNTASSVVNSAVVVVFLEIVVTIGTRIWLLKVNIKSFVVEHLGVESQGALWNEGGGEHNKRDEGELDASNVSDGWSNVSLRSVDTVDIPSKQRVGNRINDNVCAGKC